MSRDRGTSLELIVCYSFLLMTNVRKRGGKYGLTKSDMNHVHREYLCENVRNDAQSFTFPKDTYHIEKQAYITEHR